MSPSTSLAKYGFWGLNTLLGAALAAELCGPHFFSFLDALTIALAALASIVALSRQLPLQNVLPVAAVCAVAGGLAHGLSANPSFHLPFGPIGFRPAAGEKLFNFVPWTIPLIWIIAVFNARGTARLILRPWRKVNNYGFRLIGLTALLAVAFDLALEPFAWQVKHFWFWQATKIPVTWQGVTPLNFLSWACLTVLIMILVTPVLIRKQPGHRSKPDLYPLMLWLGALVWFGAGAAEAGLWLAAGVDAALAAVTGCLAIRGMKW
jgi:putative membrane protein